MGIKGSMATEPGQTDYGGYSSQLKARKRHIKYWAAVVVVLVALEFALVASTFLFQAQLRQAIILSQPSTVPYESMINLITWTSANGYSALQWNAITELAMFHVWPLANGGISYDVGGAPLNYNGIVTTAHSHNVKVTLAFGGDGLSPTIINNILANSTLRTIFINNLISEVQNKNYDGVQVDFEGTFNRAQFTAFMQRLSSGLWAVNPNYIIDVQVADWEAPDFNVTALEPYTTHFNLMFNASQSDIGSWAAQLQNPARMANGYDFVDDPETPAALLPKLKADKQANYGVFFWEASTANASYYSVIEQALGNLSSGSTTTSVSTTVTSSTALTTVTSTAATTSTTAKTTASTTSTIPPTNPKFSLGNNVIILYPTTLWQTPTNAVSIGSVIVGTTGTIIAQPKYDSVTALWFYNITFTTSQTGWVKETQIALNTVSTTSTVSTTTSSTIATTSTTSSTTTSTIATTVPTTSTTAGSTTTSPTTTTTIRTTITTTGTSSTTSPTTTLGTTSTPVHTTTTTAATSSTTSPTTTLGTTTTTLATTTILQHLTTSNSTLSLNTIVSSNSMLNINFNSANTIINVTSNSVGPVNFMISNVIGSAQPLAGNTLLLAINVNLTHPPNELLNLHLTSFYPCGFPSNSIRVFTLAGSSLNPLGSIANSSACKVTYSIANDPIIEIFAQSGSYTTTTTIAPSGGNGGNGGGGGGGGGGGSSKPVITAEANGTSNGYVISNIASKNVFNVTLSGIRLTITDNFIGPSSTGVTVGQNSSYTLNMSAPYLIESLPGGSIYIRLLNVSYLPVEHTISLYVYNNRTNSTSTATSNNSTTSLNVKFSLADPESLSVIPASAENSVSITNESSNAPSAPPNYTQISIVKVSSNLTGVSTLNVSVGYPCTTGSNSIAPFILQNGTWHEPSSFKLNSTSCTVTLKMARNGTLGVMQFVASVSLLPTTTIGAESTTTRTLKADSAEAGGIYLAIGAGMVLLISSLSYVYVRKLHGHMYHIRITLSLGHHHAAVARNHLLLVYMLLLAGAIFGGLYSYSLVNYYSVLRPALLSAIANTTNSTGYANLTTSTILTNSTTLNATTTVVSNSTANTTTSTSPTSTIAQAQPVSQKFQEFGLPMGATWGVKLSKNLTNGTFEPGSANQNYQYPGSSTGYIDFTVQPGGYYYTINQIPGYNLIGYPLRNQGYISASESGSQSAQPSLGPASNGASEAMFVPCTSNCNASTQTLTFQQFGLPSGSSWSVTVDGVTNTSSSWFINFTEPLGPHVYQINGVNGYGAYPDNGTTNLTTGSNLYSVAVTFRH